MGLSFRVIDGVQKNREFTKAEISKYLSNPEQDPLSRLEDLTEDTKKEIAADPVINEAINKNRDKIIDVRQVNSYLLDHLDVDGALTQQELEECQQEVLKYTQGSSAVAPVVVAPVVVAPVVVTQMAVESVGSAGTDSLPETPFLTYFETVAPELRPMTL
ncbi:hypothetical protein BC936DRAFT_147835 [Jimgerdemannia flammicorona]|uniref:Uncharacterized protein n=1 Tax=Jimgerdemannia flammicorona TaxID=994334 RepID=A0A433D4E8_9FUNG|nr:hypothetical protein BC936DRAFT_147835 [Jimgerdemannia flammicorona]